MQPSLLSSVSLFFLLVCVALQLRTLRIHPPRLCRFEVLLIQTVLLSLRSLGSERVTEFEEALQQGAVS